MAPFGDTDPSDERQGRLVIGRLNWHVGAEKGRIHKEPIFRYAAEKALVPGGHEGKADEEFTVARCEVGKPCRFERRIEKPPGGKTGAEGLHRRKEPVDPFELFWADPVQRAQFVDGHGKLGERGQKREQTLGVGWGKRAALFTAAKGMKVEEGFILRHGRAACRFGDAVGSVVVEGKDGGE